METASIPTDHKRDMEETAHSLLIRSCLKRYEKACTLLEEDSKKDPESEPYRSKYEARDILSEVKADVAKFLDANQPSSSADVSSWPSRSLTTLLAVINHQLGVICVDTEEFSAGEELLVKCVDLIGCGGDVEPALTRDRILLATMALNQLGILWSMRGELERAASYLQRSERLYNTYHSQVGLAPCAIRDLFTVEQFEDQAIPLESNWRTLEKTFTHTTYFLAQVYSGLSEVAKAAAYCHTTLRRQLEASLEAADQFDAVDWVVNAATLSQFFVGNGNFTAARHHLACATHVLDQHEIKVMASRHPSLQSDDQDEPTNQDLVENIKHRRADVAICWAKYGIALLAASWDRLMGRTADVALVVDGVHNASIESGSDIHQQLGGGEVEATKAVADGVKPPMIFDSLEVTAIEELVTASYVLDFDQARSVFLPVQKWLQQAKSFYTLDVYASDHAEIVRDISRLYRNLIHFESSENRCCKLHKRRVDLLEAELSEFNPKYYLSVCRQLQFELAEVYGEMMTIKLSLLQDQSASSGQGGLDPNGHAVKKVNHLAAQSMKYFQAFLDSYKDKNGEMPEKYPEEEHRPALLAHFFMARLHSKLIVSDDDAGQKMEQLRRSIEQYQFVANYCARNPTAAEDMREELWICNEMIHLLPKKLDKIISGL